MEKDLERAKEQAKMQLDHIVEMVNNLNTENEDQREEAIQRINEGPLEVFVRSGWHTPGLKVDNEEYLILLCTGGPAIRIIGELGADGEPETAQLQYQDWFTPWVDYNETTEEEDEAMLTYARQFYFGE